MTTTLRDLKYVTFRIDRKAADADERTVVGIASHELVDEVGEVVAIDGIKDQYFARHPHLYLHHDLTRPVGTVVRWWRAVVDGAKALLVTMHFPKGDKDADEAWEKIQNGLLGALSIGFHSLKQGPPHLPGQTGVTHLESELIDISLVAAPACATCVIMKCACSTQSKGDPMHTINIDLNTLNTTIRKVFLAEAPGALAEEIAEAAADALAKKMGRVDSGGHWSGRPRAWQPVFERRDEPESLTSYQREQKQRALWAALYQVKGWLGAQAQTNGWSIGRGLRYVNDETLPMDLRWWPY